MVKKVRKSHTVFWPWSEGRHVASEASTLKRMMTENEDFLEIGMISVLKKIILIHFLKQKGKKVQRKIPKPTFYPFHYIKTFSRIVKYPLSKQTNRPR